MINKVILVGRITRDPELRYSSSNMPFVGFTIACNRAYTDRNGNRQEMTDFINCVVWNRQAENLARFVRKGTLIGVEGRLQSRSYEADGQNRSVLEVMCDSIQFLENRSNNPQQDYQPDNQYQDPRGSYQPRNDYQPNNQYQQNQYNNQYRNEPSQNEDVFQNKTADVAEDDLPF